MNIFPWDKDLESGIELIDEQHKRFLKSANTFFIKAKNKKNIQACTDELHFLQNYLLYHFQAEEAFQITCCYPNYLQHQAAHDMLKIQSAAMSIKIEQENYSTAAMSTFETFINEWVKTHILGEDMIFSQYYKYYTTHHLDKMPPVNDLPQKG